MKSMGMNQSGGFSGRSGADLTVLRGKRRDGPSILVPSLSRFQKVKMENIKKERTSNIESGYRRCLVKAMDRTQQLLRENDVSHDYEKIHAVKSILYATIEQAGMETDRLISSQELLRELLALVALQADPIRHERQEALKVLKELKARHHYP
jgi:hypothetical protein